MKDISVQLTRAQNKTTSSLRASGSIWGVSSASVTSQRHPHPYWLNVAQKQNLITRAWTAPSSPNGSPLCAWNKARAWREKYKNSGCAWWQQRVFSYCHRTSVLLCDYKQKQRAEQGGLTRSEICSLTSGSNPSHYFPQNGSIKGGKKNKLIFFSLHSVLFSE